MKRFGFFLGKILFPPLFPLKTKGRSVSGKTCFVATLTPAQMKSLREQLASISAWEFSDGPYMLFKASREKTQVAAYRSGKLVVQGAGTPEFVEFVLEPLIGGPAVDEAEPPPLLEFKDPHAGIDESGKGDFFGPLVVACVFVENAEIAAKLAKAGVRDSKAIKDDSKIAALAETVKRTVGGKFGVVVVGPEAYNRTYESIGNLNRLLAWGHARALENMLKFAPECRHVISDQFGDKRLVENALLKNGRAVRLEQFPRGERDVAVAAASILARAEFVRRIAKLEEEAGCALPKGAGTEVDKTASRLYLAGGEALLRKFAKMHFRTARKAMGLPLD